MTEARPARAAGMSAAVRYPPPMSSSSARATWAATSFGAGMAGFMASGMGAVAWGLENRRPAPIIQICRTGGSVLGSRQEPRGYCAGGYRTMHEPVGLEEPGRAVVRRDGRPSAPAAARLSKVTFLEIRQ